MKIESKKDDLANVNLWNFTLEPMKHLSNINVCITYLSICLPSTYSPSVIASFLFLKCGFSHIVLEYDRLRFVNVKVSTIYL